PAVRARRIRRTAGPGVRGHLVRAGGCRRRIGAARWRAPPGNQRTAGGAGLRAGQCLAGGARPGRGRDPRAHRRQRGRGARLPGVTLHDLGEERSALVSFNVDGMTGPEVRAALAAQGINISANGIPYTPLDMRARGLVAVARAAVSYLTTGDEIDRLVAAVRALAK